LLFYHWHPHGPGVGVGVGVGVGGGGVGVLHDSWWLRPSWFFSFVPLFPVCLSSGSHVEFPGEPTWKPGFPIGVAGSVGWPWPFELADRSDASGASDEPELFVEGRVPCVPHATRARVHARGNARLSSTTVGCS
jgi:hypothetical protein